MSAVEVANQLDTVMNDLGSVRFTLINARQAIIDAQVALNRINSFASEARATDNILENLKRDLGDDVESLLHANEQLTQWRIKTL